MEFYEGKTQMASFAAITQNELKRRQTKGGFSIAKRPGKRRSIKAAKYFLFYTIFRLTLLGGAN